MSWLLWLWLHRCGRVVTVSSWSLLLHRGHHCCIVVVIVVLWSSLLCCGRCGCGCGCVMVVVIVASWLLPWLLHCHCVITSLSSLSSHCCHCRCCCRIHLALLVHMGCWTASAGGPSSIAWDA